MTGYRVGVLGATGRLGRELLIALDGTQFPVQSCVALTTDPERAGAAVRFGSRTVTTERLDAGASDLDVLFSAIPPGPLGRLLERARSVPLVINAAGVDEGTEVRFAITDVDLCEPLPGARDGEPRVITLPRWVVTQLARALRPIVAELDLTRVRVWGAPATPDAVIDEQLAPVQLQALLGREFAFGYEPVPIPDDGQAVQLSAELQPLLKATAIDALEGAPRVAVRLDIGGESTEARRLAATGELVVTRIIQDNSDLGAVQVHWTAAAAARGAALQAVEVVATLAELGLIARR